MLLLVSTSDKIQVVTGQAITTDVHASYMDYDASAGTTPGRKNTAITGATTTDVVASPASGISRNVRTLTVRNKHVSSSVDVTVQHTDGTTVVELAKATLTAGQTLQFIDNVGFFIVAVPPSTKLWARVVGSDATTTGQALVDVTGLTIPLLANRVYSFCARLGCTVTAVTTGNKYGVQFTGAGATVEAGIVGASSSTTATTAERISALNTATTNAFLLSSAQTGPVWIDGTIFVGANAGNLTIQHLKVTSGTSTVKIGSTIEAELIG
jgi:hypothetical protein